MSIDFVMYNGNLDLFQSIKIHFFIDAGGFVTKKLDIMKAELNHFDTHN